MHSATFSTETPFLSARLATRLFMVAVVGSALSGCRSTRPTASMVQVTEDPAAVVTDVEAPEQRLATTATGKQGTTNKPLATASQSDLAGTVPGMPKVFQEKPATSSTTAASTTQMSLSDTAGKPNSSQNRTAATQAAARQQPAANTQPNPLIAAAENTAGQNTAGQNTAGQAPVNSPKTPTPPSPLITQAKSIDAVQVTPGGLVSASLTDLSDPKVDPAVDTATAPKTTTVAAKAKPAGTVSTPPPSPTDPEETPPAPPSEALVESSTKQRPTVRRPTFSQTDQPNALTGALEQSLAQLPELPQVNRRIDGPAPTRIGIGQTQLAAADSRSGDHSESKPADAQVGQLLAQTTPPPPPETDAATAAAAAPQPLRRANSDASSEPVFSDDEEPSIVMNANQILPASHAGGDSKIGMASHLLPSQRDTTPVRLPTQELSEAELFDELLSRISQPQPNESPIQRERRQIVMRHLLVLAGEPENAIESMESLNPTEQLYLKNQLMGLWTMIDPQGHPSSGRRITEALPKFREATRLMAAATDSLTLNSLEFCTEIESYGQIKPFEGNRFVAGQQVILYCEVENFAADPKNGYFQTQLQGSYDIYDAAGTRVTGQLLPMDQQRSRNRLRDYFVAYQMNLPKGLTPGTYRLQLTIEDVVGKKYGQSNIPFEIR